MRIIGLDIDSHEKALTPREARAASGSFTHYFEDEAPLDPADFDRWTDTTSGITYTWYYTTWVELGPSSNFIPIALAPVNTALPVISGTPIVGETVTTSNGTWEGTPTSFEYKWQINSSGWNDVPGRTTNTYAAIPLGEHRSAVRALNTTGWSEWAYSVPVIIAEPTFGMTFDGPASSSAVFTNSGSTLSNPGTGQAYVTAWSNAVHTGKVYMEVILFRGDSSDNFIVFTGDGVRTTDAASPVINWGAPRGGAALLGWSSFFRANYGMAEAVSGSITSYAEARTQVRLKVAADLATRRFWIKETGSAFAGDPVAGTGQLFTLMGTAQIMFGAAAAPGATVTFVKPSDHIDTPPSGFTAI